MIWILDCGGREGGRVDIMPVIPMHAGDEDSGRGLKRVAALLCAPPAALGLLFGSHLLDPRIMTNWCRSRRGCGGARIWQLYPHHFPMIALAFGIAFACIGLILWRRPRASSSRLGDLRERLIGIGAVFGFVTALYWIAALGATDGRIGPWAFYAPLIFIGVVVVPIEIGRLRDGKAPGAR